MRFAAKRRGGTNWSTRSAPSALRDLNPGLSRAAAIRTGAAADAVKNRKVRINVRSNSVRTSMWWLPCQISFFRTFHQVLGYP